ncbi:hypothetical protein PIB30_047783 [Stylosanthes scabra]|uniref:Retrotransposon Copia-like N-terminal domain-containing protein n=1 Tax=Stylosanthes scabra TaxID=79078 RepID=A0ABU6UFJ1_9FABA|nr:hypothetical protein [Stylosanthes scabra]
MAEIINEPNPSAAATIQNTNNQKPLAIPLSDKLTSDNFLTWRYQAIQTISGQKLQHHLEKEKVPTQYASTADKEARKEIQTYQDWRVYDYNVNAWLAKIRQLQLQLKTVKKIGSSVDYLLQIKKTIILSITSVNTNGPDLSIPDLEALLMDEEELIERLKKPDSSMVQVDVTQTANSGQRNSNSKNSSNNWNNNNNNNNNWNQNTNWNDNNNDKGNSGNSGRIGRGGGRNINWGIGEIYTPMSDLR